MKKDVRCTQMPCHFIKNKSRAITKLTKEEKEWRWMQGNYLLTLMKLITNGSNL